MRRRNLAKNWALSLLASPGVRRIGRVVPRPLRRIVAILLARLDEPRAVRLRQLSADVESRLLEACAVETDAWRQIRSQAQWKAFLEPRLVSLRRSLGRPPARGELSPRITRTLEGDGFLIDNLVFESRPGLLVTANLYRPADIGISMPGILVCHGHHAPKSQVELQDIGANLARAGSTVLIMDQLGHGERRQHPFRTSADHPGPFRLDRQDYFFRYVAGMQLQLIGESLMGWMVWDVMRGIDLLQAQRGVDAESIILIGAVAGGGAVAAVTAALDPRVAAVIPFGFGKAPKAHGVERSEAKAVHHFAGRGSWESTRNLVSSARDGFMPWTVLAAVAPRRVVYAHEFAWDNDDDPVWLRLKRVFALADVPHHLAAVHGSGSVSGKLPESTHCTNVGPLHRREVYPILHRWLGLHVPREEGRFRRPEEDLICLPEGSSERSRAKPMHRLAHELAGERIAEARQHRARSGDPSCRARLRNEYAAMLGDIEPAAAQSVSTARIARPRGRMFAERVTLVVQGGIEVEVLLLSPPTAPTSTRPVVVGVAQDGSQALLDDRAGLVDGLIRRGLTVCLCDLRGTGRTQGSEALRGRLSPATEISSSELMLGQTLLGSRLRDLRSILCYLRSRSELDGTRVALWGDSLAPTNPVDHELVVPLDADPAPTLSEPLGGLLALLCALFEDDVRASYLRGGLVGFASVLESPCCHLPHDVIVPGLLTTGDLCDLAAALAPLPLRMEGLVDGRNRLAGPDALQQGYRVTREAYRLAGAERRFSVRPEGAAGKEVAQWLAVHLGAATGSPAG